MNSGQVGPDGLTTGERKALRAADGDRRGETDAAPPPQRVTDFPPPTGPGEVRCRQCDWHLAAPGSNLCADCGP